MVDGSTIAAWLQAALSGVDVRLDNRNGNASELRLGPLLGGGVHPIPIRPYTVNLGRSANERFWVLNGPAHGYSAMFRAGKGWGSSRGASAVAFGDVDGDGRDELLVGRTPGGNFRFAVYDDATTGFASLFTGGEGWGKGRGVSAVALGDVDGDGRDELLVGRTAGENFRFAVYDDATTGFASLFTGGEDWGKSRGVSAVAFGDLDGDGRDEFVVGRSRGDNFRFAVYDDAAAGYALLHSDGRGWGGSYGVSAVACGDVDGDGRDELLVGRTPGKNMRFVVYDDATTGFAGLFAGGQGWGKSRGVSAVACGDVDGDGRDELLVGRTPGKNMRFVVYDDATKGFTGLFSGGEGWGSDRGSTAIACGDVDGDGRAEFAVGRSIGDNLRVALIDDARAGFRQLETFGEGWGHSRGVTTLAFGDSDGNGRANLTIGRNGDPRFTDRFLGRISFCVNDVRSNRGVAVDAREGEFALAMDFETDGREVVAKTSGLVASFAPDIHIDLEKVEVFLTPHVDGQGRPSYSSVRVNVAPDIHAVGGVCSIPRPIMRGDVCDFFPSYRRRLAREIQGALSNVFRHPATKAAMTTHVWDQLLEHVSNATGIPQDELTRVSLRFEGTDLHVSVPPHGR